MPGSGLLVMVNVCVCVRACTCVCGGVYVLMCTHENTRRCYVPLTISFSTFFPGGNVFQWTGAMWTGSKSQWSSRPTLQHEDYITGICIHAKIFMWVLWNQTQVLMHAQQMLLLIYVPTTHVSTWILSLLSSQIGSSCWFTLISVVVDLKQDLVL